MYHTNATQARANLYQLLDMALDSEVVSVSTKRGNAVILTEDDYNAMMETMHLMNIPGMAQSILDAAEEPLEDGVALDDVEW